MLPISIPNYYPGKLKGDLIGVTIDGHKFKCENQGEFTFDVQLIEINAQENGRFPRYRPGKCTWSITVTSLALMSEEYGDFKYAFSKVLSGQPVDIEFGTAPGVEPYYKIFGQAFVKSGSLGATNGEYLTSSITFQGSGAFQTDWNQFALIINATPIQDDKPIYIETWL